MDEHLEPLRPSAGWYAVAAGILLLSVAGAVLFGIGIVQDFVELFDVEVHEGNEPFTVDVDGPGSWTVYLQGERRAPSGLSFEVADDGGAALPVQDAGQFDLTLKGVPYAPLVTFEAKRPGTVTVRPVWSGDAPREVAFAVGRGVGAKGFVGGVFRGMLVGLLVFVGVVLALVVFLVTLIRRSNAKRRRELDAVDRRVAERRERPD